MELAPILSMGDGRRPGLEPATLFFTQINFFMLEEKFVRMCKYFEELSVTKC